jgi:alkanesulfonate monooxygenase SsuD/methylene tetrahydromethanopterin reductase-like flavin-dependent oxidoreductase (luciferase family)
MVRGIQVGVLLPNTGRGANKAALTEFAALAEGAGVDSLWVGDHIALAGRQETEYPYADHHKATYEVPAHFPFLEAFATLGFAAAVTKRCRLGLGVGILPYRHVIGAGSPGDRGGLCGAPGWTAPARRLAAPV